MTDTNAIATISTEAPAETADMLPVVHRQIADTIRSLPWPARRAVARQVNERLGASIAEVARGKFQAAAEAELACFVQARLAERQVVTVHTLRNEAALRGIVAMTLSEVKTQLLRIAMQHEDNIDAVATAWQSAIATKVGRGQITQDEAETRLNRLSARSERLRVSMEEECDALVESFRFSFRARLERLQTVA
jgi:hypothetical protein